MMRVLVLGTVRPGHQRLFDMGHEVILFVGKKSAKPIDISAPYSNVCVLNDNDGGDVWVQLAVALHQVKPFDAVCTFHDNTQAYAIEIAKKLGLYYPVELEAVELVFNKFATRQALRQCGLDSLEHYMIEDGTVLNDVIGGLSNYPYIIKPLSGTGSVGIIKLNNKTDVELASERYAQQLAFYPAILERFVEGDEYSVEGFSDQGTFHLLSITQKFKDPQTFVEIGHATPAAIGHEQKNDICAYVTKVLAALNIHNGPSHTEIIVSGKTVFLVETHTRVGGDCIADLVKHAIGVDLYQLVALQSCGLSIASELNNRLETQRFSAIWYKTPALDQSHIITEVTDLTTLTADDRVVSRVLLKTTGDTIGPLTHSFDRLAYSIAIAENIDDAVDAARNGVEAINITSKAVAN